MIWELKEWNGGEEGMSCTEGSLLVKRWHKIRMTPGKPVSMGKVGVARAGR